MGSLDLPQKRGELRMHKKAFSEDETEAVHEGI
jgi:hypothetical protein